MPKRKHQGQTVCDVCGAVVPITESFRFRFMAGEALVIELMLCSSCADVEREAPDGVME